MQKIPFFILDSVDLLSGLVLPINVKTEGAKNAIKQKTDTVCISSKKSSKIAFIARIDQSIQNSDGSYKVLLELLNRVQITSKTNVDDCIWVSVEDIEYTEEETIQVEAMRRVLIDALDRLYSLQLINDELVKAVKNISDPDKFSDYLVINLSPNFIDKKTYAKLPTSYDRIKLLLDAIEREILIKQEEINITSKTQKKLGKASKEAYLREQLKVIQGELGEDESTIEEIDNYEELLYSKKMPSSAMERIESEIKKFRMMSAFSAEASVTRSWLECVLSLPWGKKSKIAKDLKKAKQVLDKDHFGLTDVKEHILEFLAVQARKSKKKGQIICLVGPPGIGKTSLAKSIAEATGREFVRISLGGVKDESEIRGHRRTYVSAFCGRIISAVKKAGTSNPLILLDEVDKIGEDLRGSPEAALLEVLDPEQNSNFVDHYVEMEYDLSDVMFVATANTLQMSKPLLDRMDVIRLSGYTEQEKFEIAKRYLLKKQINENGLKINELSLSDCAIIKLIQDYTREAGVRNLERQIAKLARKAVKSIAEGTCEKLAITAKNLAEFAGPQKYTRDGIEDKNFVGVTTGLAWTEVGGEILSIESVMYPGKGKIILTGKLGDVMQESIQAAMSFVRSKSQEFNLSAELFDKNDFHIHVPEGATPKDGPSAGIAMVTSIMSSATGIPVRNDVAMTGEITLRGRILPIGGLKEKILAAHREKIKIVIIPKGNESDLTDIPDDVKNSLEIKLLENVTDVLKIALQS